MVDTQTGHELRLPLTSRTHLLFAVVDQLTRSQQGLDRRIVGGGVEIAQQQDRIVRMVPRRDLVQN